MQNLRGSQSLSRTIALKVAPHELGSGQSIPNREALLNKTRVFDFVQICHRGILVRDSAQSILVEQHLAPSDPEATGSFTWINMCCGTQIGPSPVGSAIDIQSVTVPANGPCVGNQFWNQGALARTSDALRVSDAKQHGGRVVCGGVRPSRPGFFYPPTVLLDVPEDAKIFVDEPFGPILPITRVNTIEEAVLRANRNPYGLASYVFAGDHQLAGRICSQLAAGSVGVNQMKGVPPDAASKLSRIVDMAMREASQEWRFSKTAN